MSPQSHRGETRSTWAVQCRGSLVSLQNWTRFCPGGFISCGSLPDFLAQAAAAKMLQCLPQMMSSSSLVALAGECLDPAAPSSDSFLDPRTWGTHAESAGPQPRRD